ncbi:Myb-like DNA-binding domain protein [Aspergillus mulundensis]|uniref:Myb-like domain-containing protein n=1 Tax=Aspergillus mulundensis TaxID=1810919 RepID=A0A3D8S603_9EURO|nr:hypothetical protein DSM5745_05243 [Aspergillus mulundensis]RDW81686.1 hypothetical protein DSM5745_05243 [Aspergillus mulundensis]
MEAPLKRKRTSVSPVSGNEYEPSEVDLQEARAQNDLRLKSIFEGIFEKYGRDFTDVGDEIDLQTGKITVNNGHIDALDREGSGSENWMSDAESQASTAEANEGEQARLAHEPDAWGADDSVLEGQGDRVLNQDHPGRRAVSILSHMRPYPQKRLDGIKEGGSDREEQGDEEGATSEAEGDRLSVDSLMDSALSLHAQGTRKVGKTVTGETRNEKAIPHNHAFHQSPTTRTKSLDETVEPIWRVPEIGAKFATPTLLSRSRPKAKPVNKAIRSQSPPGAGSLWALPWTTRRNTDVIKKKSKQKDSPKKRKMNHSSPVLAWDWSFADAPDGSESDDPLQEDYEPSPMPKRSLYIREKRKGPFSASGAQKTCTFCKRTFSKQDYVMHMKAVMADPADNEHDLVELRRQLATVTDNSATGRAPDATPTGTASAPASEVIVRPTNTPKEPESNAGQETNHESTPTGHKRARTVLGPQEARLIIQLRQVQGLKWKEISDHFPQKKPTNIQAWHHVHWNQRKANPPQLSGPWSNAELEKLENLKDQPELTWPDIRVEFPGRLLPEIEFKLLQIWAGDDVSQATRSLSPAE